MKTRIAQAFTLIELLIVVAIIAILAAIAVPNFLEAQVRAKVSRAQNDLRTIVTALESYRVDNSLYPPCTNRGNPDWAVIFYEDRYRRLTTPLAYLTSTPPDIFGQPFVQGTTPGFPADPMNPTGLYDYWTFYDATQGYEVIPAQGAWNFPRRNNKYEYQLRSFGPDLSYEGNNRYVVGERAGLVFEYDPTNGTVSRGDIIRWGPGGSDGY